MIAFMAGLTFATGKMRPGAVLIVGARRAARHVWIFGPLLPLTRRGSATSLHNGTVLLRTRENIRKAASTLRQAVLRRSRNA